MLFCVLVANGQTKPPDSTDTGKAPTSGVFRVCGGVSWPRITYQTRPEYSETAREAGLEGTCALWVIVGLDGKARVSKVARSLGLGLDEKAIEAVSSWKFEPARREGGEPVTVMMEVKVPFRLNPNENAKISDLRAKADAGEPEAELELSSAYFDGRDVPKNEVQGLRLLESAANQGLAKAQFQMGEHAYARGGGSADYVNAYVWYELARRGGYKGSAKMLKKLSSEMSREQLSDARKRVNTWQSAPAK
jgi:TonB family protein